MPERSHGRHLGARGLVRTAKWNGGRVWTNFGRMAGNVRKDEVEGRESRTGRGE